MSARVDAPAPISAKRLARLAGALYLVIIVCGIWAEAFVRGSIIVSGDPAATAANLVGNDGLFRMGFMAETVMAIADVGVTVLLYVLLRPVSKPLALAAAAFHLTQTGVLALNMLNAYVALLILTGPVYVAAFDAGQLEALAALFVSIHGHGYSLALIFFGMNCLCLGLLIMRARFLPRPIGALVFAAGLAYILTSELRFALPESYGSVTFIFVVPLIAELSLGLWLLVRGVDEAEWRRAKSEAPD